MNQEPPLNLEASRTARRYDFDWLKVIATFTVFIFHCLRFFDFGAWHVKNNQLDAIATTFAGILLQWIMPLFFLLSGTSSPPRQFCWVIAEDDKLVHNKEIRVVSWRKSTLWI
jgi:Acyltransferase family